MEWECNGELFNFNGMKTEWQSCPCDCFWFSARQIRERSRRRAESSWLKRLHISRWVSREWYKPICHRPDTPCISELRRVTCNLSMFASFSSHAASIAPLIIRREFLYIRHGLGVSGRFFKWECELSHSFLTIFQQFYSSQKAFQKRMSLVKKGILVSLVKCCMKWHV